jgi:peptidyl-prolyl cis-trans isomerase SurA
MDRGHIVMANPQLRRHLSPVIATAVLAAALMTGTASRGYAQQVVVMVDGEPITAMDIEQRSKLIQASIHKVPSQQEVLDDLINDKLEVKEAKKYTVEASDKDVDKAYSSMASRMNLSAEQLTEVLAKTGIRPDTMKSRIRAQIVWGQLVRGRFQSSLQFGDKDILNALGGKADEKDDVGYEYRLRPILFIVQRGAPPETFEARRKDAEALRARFQSCEDGLDVARALPDVAVRDPIIRNSADLAETLRAVLDGMELGRLTPPEVTKEGVQVFAVCGKKQTNSDSPGKKAAREKLFASRYEQLAQRYLKEVRRSALIEYR